MKMKQSTILIHLTNVIRTYKPNSQEVVQSFLPFNSCRDSLSCVIYIMLFYECLIFVLSALRVTNSEIPPLGLNYSLKFTMDFFVILRGLISGNNISYKYYNDNFIRKIVSWNVLLPSFSSILFRLILVIWLLQKSSLSCYKIFWCAFWKKIEVYISSWVALDYSVWLIIR